MSSNIAKQFLLSEDVTFLNHGSYGACPRVVFEAYQEWQRVLESQPVAFFNPKHGLPLRVGAVRHDLGAFLGTSGDNIVGMMNVTMALNLVARSLKLNPGDEILTTDHEYAALDKTWAFVCNLTGAKIRVVTVPMPLTSEEAFTQAILDGMTDKTRVLFLSHITSPTALVLPIERSVAEAKKRGILTVIDGSHAPGLIPLDLEALDADFYGGNCHKWMMSPKGAGFLYVRPEMQDLCDPLIISHGWTADGKTSGKPGPFGNTHFIDSIEFQGTRDPSAWLAVSDAIRFRQDNNWDQVAKDCRDLAQETARRVQALTGLAPLSSPEFCAPQMVAMPVPECDPDWLHDTLIESYNIEIPCFKWQDHHIVRVSIQGYNDRRDTDRLIEALTELLKL